MYGDVSLEIQLEQQLNYYRSGGAGMKEKRGGKKRGERKRKEEGKIKGKEERKKLSPGDSILPRTFASIQLLPKGWYCMYVLCISNLTMPIIQRPHSLSSFL